MEDVVRNIEVILDYLDSKGRYFSNRIRNKIVEVITPILLRTNLENGVYIERIKAMDFSRKKVLEDLANKEVNCDYRLNLLEDVVLCTEGLVDELIEREKNFFFNRDNKKLYNRLYEEKEKGKVFKREDLTYDTKSQVRYARKKSGLVNISIVKLKLFPESYAYYLEENGQRGEGISNYILENIIQEIGNFSSAFIPHSEDEIPLLRFPEFFVLPAYDART